MCSTFYVNNITEFCHNIARKGKKMSRGKHCTEEKRNLIQNLRRQGKTYKEIEILAECSPTVIANALKWQPKPELRGRKRTTTQRDDQNIIRLAKKDPLMSSRKIKQDLNLSTSAVTIRRRLTEAGLRANSPRKVPLLKKVHVRKRLDFVKSRVDWPVEKWRNILWTDESKIVLYGTPGTRKYVRRPPNTAYKPQYTIKTVKHGGAKINIWGCFSYHGVGPVVLIQGNMDQHQYVSILQNHMLPYAEENIPLRWVFQQDNDPKHTSRTAKKWFSDNEIQVMEWPAQSPDLNPIENLWTDIKKAVHEAKPTKTGELWNVVKTAWHAIPPKRCAGLVDSMQRRCKAVIKNKGYSTKY